MNPARKPKSFRERPIRRGWAGEASVSQPVIGDRLLAIVARDVQISLGHAVRITRIVYDRGTTLYHLTDQTIITVTRGARVTWEEGTP